MRIQSINFINNITMEQSRKENCFSCRQPFTIRESAVEVLGDRWHQRCFKCSQCSHRLLSGEFYYRGSQIVCPDCFKGFSDHTICARCDCEIAPGSTVINAIEKKFHATCFTCSTCNASLASQFFYAVDETSVVCSRCRDARLNDSQRIGEPTICAACGQTISTGKIMNALDKTFHTACFKCRECHDVIPATHQFYQMSANPVCMHCYKQRFQPKCEKCHKLIEPDEKYTTFNDLPYHVYCFTCEVCQISVAGKDFIVRRGKVFCVKDAIK